jgi:ferrous iron transport protein A
MEFDSAQATSHIPIDAQGLGFTFIGGSADVEGVAAPSRAAAPSAGEALLPLPMMTVGDRAWIVDIKGGHRMVRRLTDLGLAQGCEITIVSRAESGSVIVGFQSCRIGIGAGIAHRVIVSTSQPSRFSGGPSGAGHPSPAQSIGDATMTDALQPEILHLGALSVGQSGRILGYETSHRAYREKLLSMGLTPGTHFTVTRQAPLGDPLEIEVRGYKLSLRKGEAAALKVELL